MNATLLDNIWHYLFQDLPGSWGTQADPSQWSAYYGYGQSYDAYAYGATQDPSLYAYGAYAGYAQYPQQARGFAILALALHLTIPAVSVFSQEVIFVQIFRITLQCKLHTLAVIIF